MQNNRVKLKIILAVSIIIALFGGIWFLGFFPIARVNGEFVLFRTYANRATALEQFEAKSRAATTGGELLPARIDEIRASVLVSLVLERVLQQHIESVASLADVPERAKQVVLDTLAKADPDVLPEATEQLYGWNIDEFSKHILYPQALQNELAQALEQSGVESYDEFVQTQLNNARVTLYFVPWRWENGKLIKKE
jgi:hypothetical protein